jgi:uncharacterized protein YbaP (TraB family)
MDTMQDWNLNAVAFAFALLAATPAGADAPPACEGKDLTHAAGLVVAREKRADDLIDGDGILWRIEKPGLAPSYLYGTIHSTDDSAVALARRAAKRISGASIVATELGSMDAVEKASISASILTTALDRDHDTFEGLPENDRAGIETFAAAQGFPSQFAHHLKLWFLAILTATPACETKRQALGLPEVDQYLAETAKTSGVKVVGLETAEEQIEVLSSMRPETAVALLSVAAREPDTTDDVYATMLRLYRESRPADILPIADVIGDMSDDERTAQDEFVRLLLTNRNATMAERAAPLLKEGGAFIAVGALHLPGKGGLVERFRALGYTVAKEW